MINIERAKRLMKDYGFDVLLAVSPENVHYVTGHMSLPALLVRGFMRGALILPDSKMPILITHAIERQADIKVETKFYGRFYAETKDRTLPAEGYPSLASAVFEELRKRSITSGRLGIEEDYVPCGFYNQLRSKLPGATFINDTGIFKELRKTKSDEEISKLVKAVEVCQTAFKAVLDRLAEGASELEMVSMFKQATAAHGGDAKFAFIAAGQRSWVPVIPPSNYVPKKGDIVCFDMGVSYQGYNSDIGRTVVIGKPSAKQIHVYQALLKAQEEAIAAIAPGVRSSQVFKEALANVRAAGYHSYNRDHIGHSIGLEAEEEPFLSDNKEVLEERMVLAVELPYYIQGLGGFRVEDDVLVEKGGSKNLSTINKELVEI